MDKTLKEKIINSTFDGIDKIIENEYKNHPNESPYSSCRLQEGYNGYLKIIFKKGEINYYKYDFNWDRSPDLKINCDELKEVEKYDFAKEIVPEIKSKFEELFFKYKDSFLFRYKISLILEFEEEKGLLKDRTCNFEFYIENNERKEELKSKMNEYIKEVILDEKKAMKDDRECYFYCRNLLDFNLMEYSEKYLIELIEKTLQVMKSVKNKKLEKDFKYSILYNLKEWVKTFLIIEPKKVTEEQIELYIYKALFQIKYGTYSYDTKYGCDDLKNAMNVYHSQKAKQYLEKGTGTLSDDLIYYKDEDLECKANDILAIVNIKIKNEIATSYEKALNFLINLLANGFPHSYTIKFSSKSEKEFLNIKGLAKSSTHRFSRRILDFPELYDKLEIYAKTAMKEFEWYQDGSEESGKSCLPGSYAVFGLGLYDEKYFPLIEEYFSKVDAEHQLVHQYFIEALIDRYGVTEKSLPIILEGFLSGQFDKVFKNLAKLMKDEGNKKLLFKELENFHKYEKETILYSIWGDKWKKMMD